ncbi:cyclase family protein [Halomonas sp. DN3]|uniref:cyclase family protein n=1 Tax=Halomonas sp. DN3 TaxID=2953657 RepID=UPI00209CAAB1|nr:cyclase family protein [Halomonas sp. DN3]USZ48104.1 cyclase family protein [Halomonas sp. DN3]
MSEARQESRLNIEVDPSAVSGVLADRLDEMADDGMTLTPDDLRDWAARLRGEATSSE